MHKIVSLVFIFIFFSGGFSWGQQPSPDAQTPAAQPAAEPHQEAAGPHWGYEGTGAPENWGTLSADFSTCNNGKTQSPVNLEGAKDTALKPLVLKYVPSKVRLVNNGHTIQVNVTGKNKAVFGGKKYDLEQMHFHSQSEHTLLGQSFPMELHLVHKNAAGQLAVIGVFIKEGKENPIIKKLWANIPEAQGEEKDVAGFKLQALKILPAKKKYMNYTGSLTTPPCSENVNWHMLVNPIELSAPQIAMFSKYYAKNARPVQPLNERVIAQSKK